ncbi:MAG TPA: carboxypeptidase-like regulatory domain-containing protein, partial [Anaerolineales bacterium]
LWRARHNSGRTGTDGAVEMNVEALSQSTTKYVFQVEPSVVGGILYEGVAPAALTLQPGDKTAAPVTLRVRAKKGAIAGTLSGFQNASVGGLTVKAVHLPDGRTTLTQALADGKFVFPDLPIAKYLVMGDPAELIRRGYSLEDSAVDLNQASSVSVDLQASALQGTILHGTLRDDQGQPLPFAWAAVEGSSSAHPVDPRSGSFVLADISSKARTLIFSAPGFYSRAQVISSADPEAGFDIRLTRRSETSSIACGQGTLVLVPESLAQVQGSQIDLQQGWLWGRCASGQPVEIQAGEAVLRISSADFALEKLPNQPPWLYIFRGEVGIRVASQPGLLKISENQMVILDPSRTPAPVPIDPEIASALNRSHNIPVPDSWEPTIQAQVRDGLARIGIGAVQIFTGLGYLGLAILTVLIPGIWIYRKLKSRSSVTAQPLISGEKHD